MEFVIIPTETLKEIDTEWEFRRKSNDGTKCIIHRELLDEIMGYATTLPLENEELVENPYEPYLLVDGNEIDEMPEFKSEDLEK